MLGKKKFLMLTLSDKILSVVFIFSTLVFFLTKYIIGGSLVNLLIFGNFIYAICFSLTYVLSHSFSKRIMDLTFKVEEMAAGNLSKEFTVKGRDEIGQLSMAMNGLISRLKTGIAQDVSTHLELRQAKTDFVALASHQLRTPLSIIKWYVDFLRCGDAGEVNPEQKRYLEEVYSSNERLIGLVNALLDVSRIDVGTFSIEPEPTDIIERAESALEIFLPEIEKKKLKVEKSYDKFPKINLDPRLTKIVFENIIANAIKYTPEKGMIRLAIKKTEKDIFIKISDSGIGIPREEQPNVFTKLFRGAGAKKIDAGGTGLGLYIVKAVIEKSGGKIWFVSPSLDILLKEEQKDSDIPLDKRNRGTTINITIPLKGMKPKLGTKKLSSLK
jgi:signal transduction histidine kinase